MIKSKQQKSLSPRYQISMRSLYQKKDRSVEKEELETSSQIDEYFQTLCNNNNNSTTKVVMLKNKRNAETPFSLYFTSERRKSEALHKVVSQFSEQMVDTLFQALVMQNVKQELKIDKVSTVTNILNSFNIDPNHLASCQEQQKIQYITKKFQFTIDQLLTRWNERIIQRQKEYNDQTYTQKDKKSLDWLNLQTKFEALKSRLKVSLYEKLTQYQNIQRSLEKYSKIHLQNIKSLGTIEIITRMDPFLGQLLCSLKVYSTPNLNQMLMQYKEKKIKPKSFANKQVYKLDFEWNDQLELNFLQNRQQAKSSLLSKITSSNFNKMGFLPLMQELSQGQLSADEYNFVNQCNDLMMQCVDRKWLQDCVNRVNKDQVSSLESNLAESIIERHEYFVKIVHQARFAYLQEKSKELATKSKQHQQLQLLKSKFLIEHKSYLRRKQTYQYYLRKKPKYNYYVYYFAKIVMQRIKQVRFRRNRYHYPIQLRRGSKSPDESIRLNSSGPIQYCSAKMNRQKAIIKIQSIVRMFIARRRFQKMMKKHLLRFCREKVKHRH